MNRPSPAKRRILDTAKELIYSRSFADVGIQEICERAAVNKGSFYYFFPSKQAQTLAVIDAFAEQLQREVIIEAFAAEVAPLERLHRLCEGLFRFHAGTKAQTGHMQGSLYGNLAIELSTQDEPIRRKVDDIFTTLIQTFEATLAEAMARGEIPPVDLRASAEAMLAYVEGITLLAKSRNSPDLIHRLGGSITLLLISSTSGCCPTDGEVPPAEEPPRPPENNQT